MKEVMTRDDRQTGEWAMLPLGEVYELVDFVLSEMPITHARVCDMLAELAEREDKADLIVQDAITQCWEFLDVESTTCH